MIRYQSLLAAIIVTLMLSSAVHAADIYFYDGKLTASETALLDPVCKLILIEKPRIHESNDSQMANAALFDRPEYRMAKNTISLHHRCWATIWRMRYFSARSADDKHKYKMRFHKDMDFIINTTQYKPANWEYMPLMHIEKGDMYYWDKQYIEAITEAHKAIALNPAFTQAYSLLVKTYIAMEQKKKALETATEGLKHNPQSRMLKRLYEETGGVQPYPEPYSKPAEMGTIETLPVDTITETQSPSKTIPEPNGLKEPNDTAITPDKTNTENSHSPNPYCRFCP